MLTSVKKLILWLISLIVSCLPILFISLLSSIRSQDTFSDVFYDEFCEPSTVYISISLLFLLLIEHFIFYDDKEVYFKSFYRIWVVTSILVLICEAILYGFFSFNGDSSNSNNSSMGLFVLNLVFLIASFVIGLVKHITDIIRESKV